MKIIRENDDPRILIHLRVDRDIHAAMKEAARRGQKYLGSVYEEAAESWLQGAIDPDLSPPED
jgi:hypothetical protein